MVSVILLEHSPDWDAVRSRLEMISRKLPMFRERVVVSAKPAPPRWELDGFRPRLSREAFCGIGTGEPGCRAGDRTLGSDG